MRLISLEIENFLKFDRLSLEFPDGLTGVLGPNGVGKSSLVEAVAWALYGSVASRTRNEGIPFRRNTPCRVALRLEVEGDEYHVVRELRGASCTASAELLVNGVPKEMGTEKVNRALAGCLRMNYRAFAVSYFARQKELDALVSWQPGDRKRYILRMLGLERGEKAIEEIRRDALDLERELRGMQATLPSQETLLAARKAAREKATLVAGQVKEAQALLDAIEKELRAGRERLEQLEAQQRRYSELERVRDLAGQALDNARREEAIYSDRVQDLRQKQAELAKLEPLLEPLAGLRERRQVLELAAGMEKRRASLKRAVDDYDKEAAELAAQAQTLEKQAALRDKHQRAQEQAEAEAARARQEQERVQGQIAGHEARLAQIKKDGQRLSQGMKQIKEEGPKGKCPTCHRVLNGSYADVVAHLEEELCALRQEHDEYTRFLTEDSVRKQALQRQISDAEKLRQQHELQLRQALKAEARLEETRNALQRNTLERGKAMAELAEMGGDGYDAAEHQAVKARLQELEKTERRAIGLRHEVERLPEEEARASKARAAIPERDGALRQAQKELQALGFDPAAFEGQRQECRALESRRERQAVEVHRLERERERALSAQQQAEEQCDRYYDLLEQINAKRAQKEHLDELHALMQTFRVNLIGRIRPALAAQASSLVRDLTDGRYSQVELDEEYNIWMYDDGERRELRCFSGGENDLVHLCVRLAISEMIAGAAGGAEHGFLVLDEVLGSQDGERRALILQALAKLSRRFRQILMITHLEDVKEMVEHVVELRETAGGSSEVVRW